MKFLKFFYLTVFITLFISYAFSATTIPEVCGNGIDDGASSGTAGSCPTGYVNAIYGSGCDLQCPEPDKDHDGYGSSIDCDDNNRLIYTGVAVQGGCSGSNYKICQADGTYTSCQTGPLTEHTGSGHDYYIDCGSGGNDSTGDGSYANPWHTWNKVSGSFLVPGDVVWQIGTTNCVDHTFSYGGNTVLAQFSVSGTSADHIKLKRYPGSTASFIPSGAVIFYIDLGVNYYDIENMDISCASGSDDCNITTFGSHTTISRTVFHEIGGSGNDNFAAIYSSSGCSQHFHHNIFDNIYAATGNYQNVSGINVINDPDDSVQCGSHTIEHNVFTWNPTTELSECAAGSKCGNGIFFKHGVLSLYSGINNVRYNYFIAPNFAVRSNTSGLRIYRNLIINPISSSFLFWATDGIGDMPGNEDETIEYNTIVNGQGLEWNWPAYLGYSEKIRFRYNIVQDNETNYNIDNGIIRIHPYGSNSNYTTFKNGTFLESDYNNYYNATTSPKFNFFSATEQGSYGSSYSYSSWKSTEGYDPHGANEDPVFDSKFRSTADNTKNWGWLLTSEEGATPTPTPTPTLTPTPIPTPIPNEDNGIIIGSFFRRSGGRTR